MTACFRILSQISLPEELQNDNPAIINEDIKIFQVFLIFLYPNESFIVED